MDKRILKGIAFRLAEKMQDTTKTKEKAPVTLFVKGIIVSGYLESWYSYAANTLKEHDEYAKEQLIYSRITTQDAHDQDFAPHTVVITNATIWGPANFLQEVPAWFGNIDEIDGYLDALFQFAKPESDAPEPGQLDE